jgi:hypothetical protein
MIRMPVIVRSEQGERPFPDWYDALDWLRTQTALSARIFRASDGVRLQERICTARRGTA